MVNSAIQIQNRLPKVKKRMKLAVVITAMAALTSKTHGQGNLSTVDQQPDDKFCHDGVGLDDITWWGENANKDDEYESLHGCIGPTSMWFGQHWFNQNIVVSKIAVGRQSQWNVETDDCGISRDTRMLISLEITYFNRDTNEEVLCWSGLSQAAGYSTHDPVVLDFDYSKNYQISFFEHQYYKDSNKLCRLRFTLEAEDGSIDSDEIYCMDGWFDQVGWEAVLNWSCGPQDAELRIIWASEIFIGMVGLIWFANHDAPAFCSNHPGEGRCSNKPPYSDEGYFKQVEPIVLSSCEDVELAPTQGGGWTPASDGSNKGVGEAFWQEFNIFESDPYEMTSASWENPDRMSDQCCGWYGAYLRNQSTDSYLWQNSGLQWDSENILLYIYALANNIPGSTSPVTYELELLIGITYYDPRTFSPPYEDPDQQYKIYSTQVQIENDFPSFSIVTIFPISVTMYERNQVTCPSVQFDTNSQYYDSNPAVQVLIMPAMYDFKIPRPIQPPSSVCQPSPWAPHISFDPNDRTQPDYFFNDCLGNQQEEYCEVSFIENEEYDRWNGSIKVRVTIEVSSNQIMMTEGYQLLLLNFVHPCDLTAFTAPEDLSGNRISQPDDLEDASLYVVAKPYSSHQKNYVEIMLQLDTVHQSAELPCGNQYTFAVHECYIDDCWTEQASQPYGEWEQQEGSYMHARVYPTLSSQAGGLYTFKFKGKLGLYPENEGGLFEVDILVLDLMAGYVTPNFDYMIGEEQPLQFQYEAFSYGNSGDDIEQVLDEELDTLGAEFFDYKYLVGVSSGEDLLELPEDLFISSYVSIEERFGYALPDWMTYNTETREVTVDATMNEQAGLHTIFITGYIAKLDDSYVTTSTSINIIEQPDPEPEEPIVDVINFPPYFEGGLQNQFMLTGTFWSYDLPSYKDEEDDEVTVLVDGKRLNSYLNFDKSTLSLDGSTMPEGFSGIFPISVKLVDGENPSPRAYTFQIEIVDPNATSADEEENDKTGDEEEEETGLRFAKQVLKFFILGFGDDWEYVIPDAKGGIGTMELEVSYPGSLGDFMSYNEDAQTFTIEKDATSADQVGKYTIELTLTDQVDSMVAETITVVISDPSEIPEVPETVPFLIKEPQAEAVTFGQFWMTKLSAAQDVDGGDVIVEISAGSGDRFIEYDSDYNILFIREGATTIKDAGLFRIQIVLRDAETPRDKPGIYIMNLVIAENDEQASKINRAKSDTVNWKAYFMTKSIFNTAEKKIDFSQSVTTIDFSSQLSIFFKPALGENSIALFNLEEGGDVYVELHSQFVNDDQEVQKLATKISYTLTKFTEDELGLKLNWDEELKPILGMNKQSKDKLHVYLRQEALLSKNAEVIRRDLPVNQDDRRLQEEETEPGMIFIELQVQVPPQINQNDKPTSDGLAWFVTFILRLEFFILLIPTAVLMINPRSLFQTFHAMQLVGNLSLMSLQTPANLDMFFSKLYPVANFKLFDGLFDLTKTVRFHGDISPYNIRFYHIGHYETETFLPNLGPAITVFLFMGLVAGISHFTTYRLLSTRPKQFQTWYIINRFYRFTVMMVHWFNEYFFVITIACFLNMQELQVSTLMELAGTFISFPIFFFFLPQLPLIVFHFFISSSPPLTQFEDQSFMDKWGMIYNNLMFSRTVCELVKEETEAVEGPKEDEEIQQLDQKEDDANEKEIVIPEHFETVAVDETVNTYALHYVWMFYWRRLIQVAVLFLFAGGYQLLVVTIVQAVYLLYLTGRGHKVFDDRSHYYLEVYNEMFVLGCCGLFSSFVNSVDNAGDVQQRTEAGKFVLCFIAGWLITNVIFTCWESFINIRNRLKFLERVRRNLLANPTGRVKVNPKAAFINSMFSKVTAGASVNESPTRETEENLKEADKRLETVQEEDVSYIEQGRDINELVEEDSLQFPKERQSLNMMHFIQTMQSVSNQVREYWQSNAS